MMRDGRFFNVPLEFNAFRFFSDTNVNGASLSKPSRLVDASDRWLVWGSGRILWYEWRIPLRPLSRLIY